MDNRSASPKLMNIVLTAAVLGCFKRFSDYCGRNQRPVIIDITDIRLEYMRRHIPYRRIFMQVYAEGKLSFDCISLWIYLVPAYTRII